MWLCIRGRELTRFVLPWHVQVFPYGQVAVKWLKRERFAKYSESFHREVSEAPHQHQHVHAHVHVHTARRGAARHDVAA